MIVWKKAFAKSYGGLRSLLDKGRLCLLADFGGWDSAVTGSGATSQPPRGLSARTGTTASSTARLTTTPNGLSPATGARNIVDWDKKLLISFALVRLNSDTEVTAYFQLKQVGTHGNLGAKGLGVVIANLTLRGESYGTERATTTETQVMTDNRSYTITIVFDPATPECSWYVNGTLLGSITTAAALPTGLASADNSAVLSNGNGATGGVNAEFEFANLVIWQEM